MERRQHVSTRAWWRGRGVRAVRVSRRARRAARQSLSNEALSSRVRAARRYTLKLIGLALIGKGGGHGMA